MAGSLDRRGFLRGLGGVLGCSVAAHPMLTTVTMAGANGGRPLGDHRLVVIILRGAMDGLDVVQPQGDADYAALRPTLLNPQATDLDGFFRLHPAMGDLMPLWNKGQLGFVHATSTPYRDKRSHFVGQDMLEAGTGMDVPLNQVKDGWLNRLLQTQDGLTSETAYSIGQVAMPLLEGPAEVRNWSPETTLLLTPQARLLFDRVYESDPLFHAASQEAMELADAGNGDMEMMAADPSQMAGLKVQDVEQLVDYAAGKLRQDARIAAFSMSGWDTHRGQAGGLSKSLARLQYAILRLQTGLGAQVWGKTVLLAMTEFGRTARENGTAGTDHGTGGVMVMAGGALNGGKIYGDWPGLSEANLYERRDLMPTTDVRAWAAHTIRGLYGIDQSLLENTVFPGLQMGKDPRILL
ncbi:MAG: twin-arginine translocation pathway signal [Pseudorhodobacter sp. PARRP1]|nr:MAG: twin-arginine translocation pathway signal [Pseudorhodobacter sp. PARRP1]